MFERQLIRSVWMIFPLDKKKVNDKEFTFIDDIETWLRSTNHWSLFWALTCRLLDRSIDIKHSKEIKVNNVDNYFAHLKSRTQELDGLFSNFDMPAMLNSQQFKWIPIETKLNAKFKDKDTNKKI